MLSPQFFTRYARGGAQGHPADSGSGPVHFFDKMYLLISLRKSTPPQKYQLNILISNIKQQVDNFVGELTFKKIKTRYARGGAQGHSVDSGGGSVNLSDTIHL